jgi:DNA-binding beta-propeller fold protein YncE
MSPRALLVPVFVLSLLAGGLPRQSKAAAGAPFAVAGAPSAVAGKAQADAASASSPAGGRLPTGVLLDPAGRSSDLGNMPLSIALAPEGDRAVVLLAGWREQGIMVVEKASGRVLQTIELPAAFLGLAFSPDGHALYVAGGHQDVVYRFDWQAGAATLAGSISLTTKPDEKRGSRYPAGLAVSRDGRTLYAAENLADNLAVVDLASGKVVQRLPTGHYPYDVAVGAEGEVYVSAWGGDIVSVFVSAPGAAAVAAAPAAARSVLVEAGSIEVGRHPSALLLGGRGSRLFVALASVDSVAVVDTRARKVVTQLHDPPPAGPAEGSTPSALALAAGGRRLLVAESDSNAVAVFDLAAETSGVAAPPAGPAHGGRDRLAGRIPVGWYPTAVLAAGESLLVVNGKGRGTGPNPTLPHPGEARRRDPRSYTLGQTNGTLTVLPALPAAAELEALSRRVARADGWDAAAAGTARAGASTAPRYPPLHHVVFIIKENRTYDQVFGDMPGGDGDPRLQFFNVAEAPNHRALAERFGLFDHFLTNGEVSTQGHSWSTSAYSTDFIEKVTPSAYSGRRNHDEDTDPAALPVAFLWDLARARGVSVRIYGEMASEVKDAAGATTWRSTVPSAVPYTSPTYPAWDLDIKDQRRADAWLAELQDQTRQGQMPALEILHLPNDHTSGAKFGSPTPRAYMADNDLALGRIVEGLSRSPFWKDTAVFVVEDDAQNGPDHIDSHRAPLLVISPYNRPGAVHRFANTTDVLATIEEILGLATLSQFDTFGRPLRNIFAATPDLTPYHALVPKQPLTDVNKLASASSAAARESQALDWSAPDAAPAATLNQILWQTLKPGEPYPPPARLSTLDVQRGL